MEEKDIKSKKRDSLTAKEGRSVERLTGELKKKKRGRS